MPAVVFVIALVLRLWAASQILPEKAWPYFYQYNEFAHIAWAVTSGYGYSSPWANTPLAPTAVEPPVYSYVLAGIFKLAGVYSYSSLWIAIIVNAVLSAITAVLILKIGKRDFGPAVGVLAAWVWSCWLYEAAVAVRLWESSLAALLLTTALLMLPELRTSRSAGRWLLFGALAGIAALTNTTLLAIFPCFWLWLWIDGRRSRYACGKQILASVGVFVLMLLPWTIRNYEVFHRLMPLRDNLGLELWLGNHEAVTRRFDSDFPSINPAEYNRVGELKFMDEKREIALAFIRQHPGEFLKLSAVRIFRYWTAPEPAIWLPLGVLAWAGMVLALRDKRSSAVPYAIILLVFPLIYYVTHTFNSYRHPSEPTMFILAGYAVVSMGQALLGKSMGGVVADSGVH
jgi:4-amino-4-deoxy-L-arabinose transferase-like glycosyltransferase